MLLGVDVGGTFTDAALMKDGRLHTGKAPTTPADQSEGVMAAVERVLQEAGAAAGDVSRFVHGMTVGTNALLEGRTARTALLATEGFTDVEELGRQARAELYRLCAGHPPPLVPRELRVAVPERTGPQGVITPLDEAGLAARLEAVGAAESAAVCLLWGFRHREHEGTCAAIVAREWPDAHVSVSHETAGVFREYERLATTVVDAALSPLLRRYLEQLAARAGAAGLPLPEVMLSSGGVADASAAARHASWTVLSGPAGGAVGAAALARRAGADGAVGLDMGGTSCDVCLVTGGEVEVSGGREVGGRALALPMVDVHTIGAGGGSVAWRDAGGALRVGPRSAGAEPGPAAYGRGGEEPTVTDANLVLGYLAGESPLAGGVTLDRDAAERALVGLGMSAVEAAEGVVRVASAEMARAVRVMTVERGVDPRGLALLPFGGAGPLHAAFIAEELGMRRIVVPRASGVLSALGLVVSERRRDLIESVLLSGSELGADAIAQAVERLVARGREELHAPDADVRVRYDLRYRGQAFELSVPGAERPDPGELRAAFDRAHAERYGYSDGEAELELVTVRVAVFEAAVEPQGLASDGAAEERPRRGAVFGGKRLEARVLGPGSGHVEGPAVWELAEATLVVPPGWGGATDDDGTIVLERA